MKVGGSVGEGEHKGSILPTSFHGQLLDYQLHVFLRCLPIGRTICCWEGGKLGKVGKEGGGGSEL